MPRPHESFAMHPSYTQERALLLAALSRHGQVTAACRRAGISRTTFYRWRQESPEFRGLTDRAIEEGRP